MKKMSCQEIEEILVDYSDGLLSQEENMLVSQHLENCENCRNLLGALGRSLELSSLIWQDNLKDIEKVCIEIAPKVKKINFLKYVSIAASIMIIVTISLLRFSSHNNEEKPVELTFEQIQKNINDSANAARLLAATQLMEDNPDYQEMVENQYQYIAQQYPDTTVAKNLKYKIQ